MPSAAYVKHISNNLARSSPRHFTGYWLCTLCLWNYCILEWKIQ